MGMVKTIGAAAVTAGTPTPVLFAAANSPFTTYSITSASLVNGQLTFTCSTALPSNGFNGPNQAIAGYPLPAGGQQVVLWSLGVYTDLNGKKVTVVSSNPAAGTFTIYYNGAHSGTDTGKVAAAPFQHYRAIRLECSQGNGTDFVYVGDNKVSSTQYMAALSLSGQLNIEIACDNIPAECVCIDGTTTTTDKVQVGLLY